MHSTHTSASDTPLPEIFTDSNCTVQNITIYATKCPLHSTEHHYICPRMPTARYRTSLHMPQSAHCTSFIHLKCEVVLVHAMKLLCAAAADGSEWSPLCSGCFSPKEIHTPPPSTQLGWSWSQYRCSAVEINIFTH